MDKRMLEGSCAWQKNGRFSKLVDLCTILLRVKTQFLTFSDYGIYLPQLLLANWDTWSIIKNLPIERRMMQCDCNWDNSVFDMELDDLDTSVLTI